jgi:L-threonylcarbamoyladenylate synthase
MEIIKLSPKALNEAVKVLNDGGVVVCPTDTVYGFLALAENEKAVEKIFKIKKRPRSKILPVFVKDLKMAGELAEIDKNPAFAKALEGKQEKILRQKWPGPYTLILKSKNVLQTPGVCKNRTVALRIPKYKFLNNLLKKINKPLAQTSVNVSGQPPLTKINEIIGIFGSNPGLDLIIDAGNLPKTNPSTIIDLLKEDIKILRK